MSSHQELTEAFAAWLPQCRWFSGKTTPDIKNTLRSIDCIDIPDQPGGGESCTLAVLRVESGAAETTFLAPVRLRSDTNSGIECRDATMDPMVSAWLLQLVQCEGTLQTTVGTFVGHSLKHHPQPTWSPDTVSTSSLNENASNSSVLITTRDANKNTNTYVSKIFRSFHTGIHPEVEIGFLLTQSGWLAAPALVGWLEFIPIGEEQGGAVATVHEAVTPTTDTWEYSVRTLASNLHASGALLNMATRIGMLTADMHEVLAKSEFSPPFVPVIPSDDAKWEHVRNMTDHAQSVLDLLSTVAIPPPLQQRVKAVVTQRQRLLKTLETLAHIQHSAAHIRIHGDYHLGQLLIDPTNEALHVIDFEGEPQRTMAERRRRTSIFKDLAGMSRSFGYLCHQMENSTPKIKAADLTRTFLRAYKNGARGQCFYPDATDDAERLLNVFMLDKAIYELAYEAQHRPDWLEAPLTAVENFLRTGCFLVD